MMKVSVPIFVICVLLSGSQASLMDTLMTPVTWIMKGPSTTLAWLRSGSSRNNQTSGLEPTLSDPLPLIDSDIPVLYDNETNAFNDTDEIRLNPSEIDPLDNFNNASASPDEDIVDHNVELRNLSSTVDDEVTLVNDSPAEITTMPSIPPTTTLRTIKMITNTWYPSTQPITTLKSETPEDDEIREIETIDPQVTTMKPEETTLAVELVNTLRQPRKPRVHENKTEPIESSSTIGSIPETTTLRATNAPKTAEKTTQMPTTTQKPTTTPENPPASLLEALANLTAGHGEFRKGRQDYDYMPQPVYIPEIHGNEKEIEEPQFEFHSELAKALGVHHNEKKISTGKVNNFL